MVFLAAFFLMVAASNTQATASEDLCCVREAIVALVINPAEQEQHPLIDTSIFSALRKGSTSCDGAPIQYDGKDWSARQNLENFVNAIVATEWVQPYPEEQQVLNELLDMDYVWRARLKLDRADHVEPGHWEEGYAGEPNYEPDDAEGDWTFHLELINIHFNETIKTATTSWKGMADGGGWGGVGTRQADSDNAIEQLVLNNFTPITEVIYDYERIPRSAQVRPEKKVIGSGEAMTVYVENIRDHQRRASRSWQRIVVEMQEGDLLNGVRTFDWSEDRKRYAFEVGGGPIQLQYKAPDTCETKNEKVTVYNACEWGRHPGPRNLGITSAEQDIGDAEFEIVCAEGRIEFQERFRWPASPGRTCKYEDPVDVVAFSIAPTKDPCVFDVKGGMSKSVVRKTYCRDQRGCLTTEQWDDVERQTRIMGGSVNFRDSSIPPLRPWIEHRRDYQSVTCTGRESSGTSGCENFPKEWVPTYMGSLSKTGSLWGIPLEDGYVDDHGLSGGNGFSYTLRIEEEPFRRLEKRCKESMESGESVPEDSGLAPKVEASSLKSRQSKLTGTGTARSTPASSELVREPTSDTMSDTASSPGPNDDERTPEDAAQGENQPAGVPSAPPPNSDTENTHDNMIRKSIDSIRGVLGMWVCSARPLSVLQNDARAYCHEIL